MNLATISDNELINKIAKATLEYNNKLKANEIQLRQDKRLRNTRRLLKHYSNFKDHIDKAIYKGTTLNFLDDKEENVDEEIMITAIKNSISRTHIILTHVKTMLDIYEGHCNNSGAIEQRRFRTLTNFYFKQMKMIDISLIEDVDERTCLRDIRNAEDKMCALIFGIEGIGKMSE